MYRWLLNISSEKRLCNLSGQPVTACCHPHSEVFPHIQPKHSVFSFVPVASHPITGQHKKGLTTLPSETCTIDQITPKPSLPQAERAQLC